MKLNVANKTKKKEIESISCQADWIQSNFVDDTVKRRSTGINESCTVKMFVIIFQTCTFLTYNIFVFKEYLLMVM